MARSTGLVRRSVIAIRIVFGALVLAVAPSVVAAVEGTNDEVWRERIETDCKLQARKYYSVLHFKKRRIFVKHCIDRAYR